MKWLNDIKDNKLIDIIGVLIAGLFLSFCYIGFYGGIDKRSSASLSDTNKVYKRNICYDDGSLPHRQIILPRTLEIQAEDNFWEVECLNGKYYRIPREDWEDIQGKYEYDEEELIGDEYDLREYIENSADDPWD